MNLVHGGYYQPTTYQIRYFQPDGKGKLEMDSGTVFLRMTFTRWRKKHSGSITLRHRPTSKRVHLYHRQPRADVVTFAIIQQ